MIDKNLRKKKPNPSKQKDFIEESNRRFKFLESISFEENNSNFIIENSYDVLRELIESKLAGEGLSASTHKSAIKYLLNFDLHPADIKFLDEMREIRNDIKYEGKYFGLEYALKVKEFTIQMRHKLLYLKIK